MLRYALVGIVMLVLAGCSSPTPTPTATPTPSPTPTATPTPAPTPTPTPLPALPTIVVPSPLDRAKAIAEQVRNALEESETIEELQPLAAELGDAATDILCAIAAGDFEPDLELSDLTDSRSLRIGIRAFCATR